MRCSPLLFALTALAQPAFAEIGSRPLRCEVVTEAPGCLLSQSIWNFEPSGGMAIMGDTLRLAGTERISTGPDRAVILDLSLATGAILGKTLLDTQEETFRATAFSPDGQILLAAVTASNGEQPASQTDDAGETTIRIFDASGAHLSDASGLVPTAILASFGENTLVFQQDQVSLDLNAFGSDEPPATVSLRYGDGQIGGAALIPDGGWLYEHLFDRDMIWRQGDSQAAAVRSGDGRPASVLLVQRDTDWARVIATDANAADDGLYDLEFSAPVLSPDGRALAVLQISAMAPADFLLVFDLSRERPIWKAASLAADRGDPRQARYLWAADGRLVVLHDARPSGDPVLTVFAPLP